MDIEDAGVLVVLGLWLAYIVGVLALIGGVVYVAIHFISKFW